MTRGRAVSRSARPLNATPGPSNKSDEKSTIPTINRKGGLCGTSVPAFYTFSTGVEDVVENKCFSPAK
jgi:hypothetical protein